MESLKLNVTPRESFDERPVDGSFTGHDDLTKDADLCIVCQDGVRLYVHRLILSKWSRVINECPGVHNATPHDGSVVEFAVEEDSAAWREVLGLIYPVSPVTILDWDNVGRIFRLADKFAMPGVLERCQAYLLSRDTTFSTTRLRNDYILKWLAFAAQYHQKRLAEKCMQFIRLNYRSIEELRASSESCYLRDVLASTPEGIQYIIDILQFVMQQRR